jgi:hypothetical protein
VHTRVVTGAVTKINKQGTLGMKTDQNYGVAIIICRPASETDDTRQRISFETYYHGTYSTEEIRVPPFCRDKEYVCNDILRIASGIKNGSDILVESLELITKDEISLRVLALKLHQRDLRLISMKERYFDMSLLTKLNLDESGKEQLLRSQLAVWKERLSSDSYDVVIDRRRAKEDHFEECGNNDPRGIRHSLIAMKLNGRHMDFGGEMTHSQFAAWFNEYYGENVTPRIIRNVAEEIKKNSRIILDLLGQILPTFTTSSSEQKRLLHCYEAQLLYFSLCMNNMPLWRLETVIRTQAAIGLSLYDRMEDLVFPVLLLNSTQEYPLADQVLCELIRDSVTGPLPEQMMRKALTAGAYSFEKRTENFKEKAAQFDCYEQLGEYLESTLIWIH